MRDANGRDQPLEANVGRIGNLLLLPTPLNSEAINRRFEEKKEIYQKHNLRMVQEVCAKADWTLAQIEERERKIADWALTRWRDI